MEDANDVVADSDETVVEIIMASISNLKVCEPPRFSRRLITPFQATLSNSLWC